MIEKHPYLFLGLLLLGLFSITLFSCSSSKLTRKIYPPEQLYNVGTGLDPMKVHMMNGDLYVLKQWFTITTDSILYGYGKRYNPKRKLTELNVDQSGNYLASTPRFAINMKSIALVEVNDVSKSGGKLAGIAIPGTIGAILSVYCITNPKACFGSCPTFYAFDGEKQKLMAEGFSSSILPSFEKRDIDMLYWAKTEDSIIEIKLTNEALETHIIRYADIIAIPRSEGMRVFATEKGSFYSASKIQSPKSCVGSEGDCLEKVEKMDRKDRISLADSNNLLQKEYLDLEFDVAPGEKYGLVIGSRQSLMTTYLFYQGLGYLGSQAGHFAAQVERGDSKTTKRVERVWELLGGIEVFAKDGKGKWKDCGLISEMGPIASDLHLIELPDILDGTIKVKLKMTKGLWRIDYVALAGIEEAEPPIRLKPTMVMNDLVEDEKTLALMHDSLDPLITYPGDIYRLYYELPTKTLNYELFLETKGYYLEWMRDEWIAEENLKKARLMYGFPRLFMRKAAPAFKILEPQMEEQFWNSRYVKK